MISLSEEILYLHSELVAEERLGPIKDIAEIAHRREMREAMERRLASVMKEVYLLRQRFRRLPALPDLMCIKWAQSVLMYPNLCILIVDTDGFNGNVKIIRLLLLDVTERILFDYSIVPEPMISNQAIRSAIESTLGLYEAPSLPQVWPSFLSAITGRYIVSYNLKHVRQQLSAYADQYHLEPPVLIGECLLERCVDYYHSGYTSLALLCASIGHPLPEPPDCTAIDRMRGQLHLLQAMAQGITGRHQEVWTYGNPDSDKEDELYL